MVLACGLTRSHCEELVVNNLWVGQVAARVLRAVAALVVEAIEAAEAVDSRVKEKTAEVTIWGRIVVYLFSGGKATLQGELHATVRGEWVV